MTELGILANINNTDTAIQNEIISLRFQCHKCGKFKVKNQTRNYALPVYLECQQKKRLKKA